MVVTVTLNTALDRTLIAPGFTLGTSRSVDRALALGGGKGMNVARALFCQRVPVLALGFAGGLVGEQIRRSLAEEGLAAELTPISAESRTCTAIIDPLTGSATEVNEPGPAIEPAEQQRFLHSFDRALRQAQLVVLSGSLPEGVPDDFYAHLIARARAAGIPCLLDTRGAALHAGMDAAPLLVKPNQVEAAQLLGADFDPEDAAFVRQALPHPGPSLFCITLGSAGAVLHAPCGSWRAYPPQVQVVDTVGAGDSFVAGLAAALLQAMESAAGASWLDRAHTACQVPSVVESMLRLATAVSAASVLSPGAGRCRVEDIVRLQSEIRHYPLPQASR